MKKAIILVALLLVLGGGGYFGWQQMGESSPAAEDGNDGEGGFFSDDGPRFVELDLLTAPFLRGGKFVQYVVLVVSLEVSNNADVDEIHAVMPRLRDAFVTELHTIATMRNPEQKLLNMERIKSRLLASARKVMGSGIVRDVLVQIAQ